MITSLSIIITTRDRAEHLKQTLDSMRNVASVYGVQPELIVVDNGSTDGTAELLNAYGTHSLNLVPVSEPRKGQAIARNTGLARATGDLIQFTDDDVRPDPAWLRGMVDKFESGGVDAVAGGIRLAPHLLRDWMRPVHRGWLASSEIIREENPYSMYGANLAFHRRVLDKVPGFDPETGPGALGFNDDSLFSWMVRQAGFRIGTALDVQVEHHFQEDRLLRSSFLDSAAKKGRSDAYTDYHWRHEKLYNRRKNLVKCQLELWRGRWAKRSETRITEGAPEWELKLVKEIAYWKQAGIERRRPRNYEKLGLRKINGVLPTVGKPTTGTTE